MDSLFHFVFALVGGYALVKGLGVKYNPYTLVLLSLSSLLIDLDHLSVFIGLSESLKLHNIFIALIPLLAYIIYRNIYFIVFTVMLLGHLIADTVQGIYGIPLFYPLTKTTYLIPKKWEIYLGGDPTSPIVSTFGIGITLYFGLILLIIIIPHLLSSTSIWRKKMFRKRCLK